MMRTAAAAVVFVLVLAASPPLWGQMTLPEFEIATMGNGLTVYMAEDHYQPVVFLRAVVLSGSCSNPDAKNGLAGITASSACTGVPGIETENAITDSLGRLGARHSHWTSCDATGFSMDVIAETWGDALPLFASIIVEPTFPERELERIRDDWMVALDEKVSDVGQLAAEHLEGVLYGSSGPTRRELRGISREDLVEFHRTHYLPNRTVIIAIGDFDTDSALDSIRRAFGQWRPGDPPPPFEPPRLRDERPAVRLVDKPGLTQATVVWGQPGLSMGDPDREAFMLGGQALGSGDFSSRLTKEVRVEGGRTYDIRSIHESQARFGVYRIQTSTRNEGLGATMRTIRSVTEEFLDDGVTEEELEKARAYVLGAIPLQYETPSHVANALARYLSKGLTLEDLRELPERYGRVTQEDARAVLSGTLHPDEMKWVVVGDRDVIGDELEGFGRIEVRDYREIAGEVGLLERTRWAVGAAWSDAVRGPRVAALHRWFGVSAAYGFESSDETWGHDWSYCGTLDVHQMSSEYSNSSVYVGVTYLRSTGFRGVGPHAGFRLFPGSLGNRASVFVQYDRPIWLDEPAGDGMPEGIWSLGFDWFLR